MARSSTCRPMKRNALSQSFAEMPPVSSRGRKGCVPWGCCETGKHSGYGAGMGPG